MKRPWALLVILSLAVPALPLAKDAALADTEGSQARTTVSEVVNHRFDNGDPGGLGYKVTHEVLAPMAPEDQFPSVRVDPVEDPDGFEGQWADSGFHAAWVAPKTKFQYVPDAYTIESGYFDNSIRFDGAPLAPGDSVDIAVKQLAGDAPLTWDTPRGNADGEMEWDIATQSHTVEATYGDASNSMEVVFVRADLVARGGDFDARDDFVRLPPLVIDLPRTYGPETRASAAASQFAPYLHYIRNIEGAVLPQSGKAVFTASTRGYIPEERVRTLPGGTHIREWHIPLNIVITLTDSPMPVGAQTLTSMPGGGVVWAFDGTGRKRIEVPAGGRVLTGDGLPPRVTAPQDAPDAPAGSQATSGSGTLMDDIEATASIDRTLDVSKTIQIAKRSFGLTIDPDLNGQGILGIRTFKHVRSGQGFFETSAVPYVTVNAEVITLDRSRLIDLRVVPLDWWLRIGFGSKNDGTVFDPTSSVTMRDGRINRTAVAVEAVYDLGDDRYAFVSTRAAQQAGSNGEVVETRLLVRSMSGAPAQVSAVQYMELSEPGPIIYDGQVMTTEFTGPAKTLTTPSARILGGAVGGSQMTVVRAGAPLSQEPTADPGASIEGHPIGVYMTSDEGTPDGLYGSVLLSWLNELPPQAQVEPAPIDVACTEPPIVDDETSDAPEGLDITRSWFDFDGANLYATIELVRLDEGALGSPASFRASWRFEHVGWGLQAARDVAGNWTYGLGLHSSAGTPWGGAIGSVPVTGELRFGSPGYIRMSFPTDVQFSSSGFLDGELLRDTGATSFDSNGVQDRVPEGATDFAFGRGGDYVVATCSGEIDPSPTPTPTQSPVPETTEVLFTDRSATAGQYSDETLFEADLTDSDGDPLAGRELVFELTGAESSRVFSATTDENGVASVTPTLTEKPGPHQLTVRFAGDDDHASSADSTAFVVDKEDSTLELTVEGKGNNRTLTARLFDEDTTSDRIAERTIDFYADGEKLGSATTDTDGVATLQAPPRYRGGKHDFEARFEGDDYYRASSDRDQT